MTEQTCWRRKFDGTDRSAALVLATRISSLSAAGILEMWPAWAMH
jgi:hypothetical protein